MNLTVKAERGALIWKYDPDNNLLYMQWKFNKVMNLILTLGVSSVMCGTYNWSREENNPMQKI